jgi:hypothetical protein
MQIALRFLKVRFHHHMHVCNKLADNFTKKNASQTNIAHFCHVRQSEVCIKTMPRQWRTVLKDKQAEKIP